MLKINLHARGFYPPKGAAKAEPVWGPIVFTYILFILGSRSRKGTWKGDFPRENKSTKMYYCDGWEYFTTFDFLHFPVW